MPQAELAAAQSACTPQRARGGPRASARPGKGGGRARLPGSVESSCTYGATTLLDTSNVAEWSLWLAKLAQVMLALGRSGASLMATGNTSQVDSRMGSSGVEPTARALAVALRISAGTPARACTHALPPSPRARSAPRRSSGRAAARRPPRKRRPAWRSWCAERSAEATHSRRSPPGVQAAATRPGCTAVMHKCRCNPGEYAAW